MARPEQAEQGHAEQGHAEQGHAVFGTYGQVCNSLMSSTKMPEPKFVAASTELK